MAALAASAPCPAGGGVDVTIPLVEQTLGFLRVSALDPPPDHVLLRAGALRVCGPDLSSPGCLRPGSSPPRPGLSGPEANRVWREVIESALAAEALSQGSTFDRTAFQRYVMDAMVEALGDPASFYVLPAIYRKIAAIPSSFVGFGVRVVPAGDVLVTTVVHPGSPAAAAGVTRGTRIVGVNGKGVTGYLRPAALAAIWGADGDLLRLKIEHGPGTREIELTYRPWSFTPFVAQRRGRILAVEVHSFGGGLAERVRRELNGPCDPAGIVLDLRDASGGDEEEMIALADLLLGGGPLGSREMREALGSRTWVTADGTAGERADLPAAVVIGPGTSGLAEVLAAALRTPTRAILVGGRTAGLDTLETLRPFSDGSAIQVTSTRLRGPGGASLSAGVLPHLETGRSGVVDLAVHVLEDVRGDASLETLLDAARRAVPAP
ncbi:MAG TPA: S41 family peptidase [Phycisphaerae bacterium]|nr:S41 family peptidase [Phycisphaerae bacterium]